MLTGLHAVAYTGVAFLLLTVVGNWLCRALFSFTGLSEAMTAAEVSASPAQSTAQPPAKPAGRTIGWLERVILAIGIVTQRWEILAAVIALKTVARFKELDEQLPAEYFLVGSLFSILWAMLVTAAWVGYDHQFGMDLHHMVTAFTHPEPDMSVRN